MSLNAVMKISNAPGESVLDNFAGWIELQGWDWEVEAETSWTKGGGASVGKPNPGKMNWEHFFDKSSPAIMNNICSGKSFEEMNLRMFKGTGAKAATKDFFFSMDMHGVFITKVSNSATDEGNVLQKVEMVFKHVLISYRPQISTGKLAGTLEAPLPFEWDIPAGKVPTAKD
jgi:type VI secretion system Hcp family effector